MTLLAPCNAGMMLSMTRAYLDGMSDGDRLFRRGRRRHQVKYEEQMPYFDDF